MNQVTVITGANRGIGLELARQINARGDEVIAIVRRSSPELEQLGIRIETGFDVAKDDVVAPLQQRLSDLRIDCLINNAGVLAEEALGRLNWNAIRNQFEVNSLGPLRTVAALRDNLRPGAKVINITSRMGSMGDNTSGGFYGYRMSKAALNAATVSMAIDLRAAGIMVMAVHPGWVRTDMTAHNGAIDPSESATGILEQIDQLTPELNGSFWHANGQPLPW